MRLYEGFKGCTGLHQGCWCNVGVISVFMDYQGHCGCVRVIRVALGPSKGCWGFRLVSIGSGCLSVRSGVFGLYSG